MNRVQLLKLAYARGAYLALQEAGYQEKVAEDLAMKIADRDALDVLEDVGIGAGIGGLGGAALGAGAGALYNPIARRIGPMVERNLTNELLGQAATSGGADQTMAQKLLASLAGGVPGAEALAAKFPESSLAGAPNKLRELIRQNAMAGNMNVGIRGGALAGVPIGGAIGGLAGE